MMNDNMTTPITLLRGESKKGADEMERKGIGYEFE